MTAPRKWAIVCFSLGIVQLVAFCINPQPYGLYGFLFFLWAWMLWNE